MKVAPKLKTLDLAYIGMFVAVIVICSWISVPLTVPFTMQTFGVFVTIALLGTKKSLLAMIIYMAIGLIGVPVFSGFGSGPGVLIGPTGGYLLGFFLTVIITGPLIRCFGRKPLSMALSMAAGLLACYTFGTLWFIIVYSSDTGPVELFTALTWCVVPFIIPDICKIALAILVQKRLRAIIP